MVQTMRQRADDVIQGWDTQIERGQFDKRTNASAVNKRFPTIFHEILSTDLPASEKRAERIGEEGFVIIAAGSETTGRTLTAATYYLLSSPEACVKLKDELKHAMPDETKVPRLKELEQLPRLVSRQQNTLMIDESALGYMLMPHVIDRCG